MSKAKDLRDQSNEELESKKDGIEKEIFTLKSKLKAEKKIEKPHQLKELRRDRARILTVLSERESTNE